jgi:hypothetical protein
MSGFLLSQVEFCAKVRSEEYSLCVDNLISLLSADLRSEVLREYSEVKGLVLSAIKSLGPKCCKLEESVICYCNPQEALELAERVVKAVKQRDSRVYERHWHVLRTYAHKVLRPVDNPVLAHSMLKFSVALGKLLDSGVIAPKSASIIVGRVEEED